MPLVQLIRIAVSVTTERGNSGDGCVLLVTGHDSNGGEWAKPVAGLGF